MSEILNSLVAASRQWIGDSPTGAMLGATRAFIAAASHNESLLREAVESLQQQEPGPQAWLAMAFGTLAESGASAELTGPVVLEQVRTWLPLLPDGGSGDEPPPVPTPEQAIRLSQFQFLCQSAVTHLARLPSLREAMGRDSALLDRLDGLRGYSYGAWWVLEALLKSSGTVVVLHPPSYSGLRLEYSNISNAFHLFSLLQRAVGTRLPGGRKPPAADAPLDTEAWWHYGSPTSPQPDLTASIGGEGSVRDIPRVDGEQVVLLWPPILARRGWDTAFFSPHLEALPASARVERMLTEDESRAWLEKLGVSGTGRRPWWRFW
jgi:hypothetical protein